MASEACGAAARGRWVRPRPNPSRSSKACSAAAAAGRPPDEAVGLLSAAGIESAASRVAASAEDALRAASAVGYPVALKAWDRRCCTRPNAAPCRLNIADEAGACARAYADFAARFGDEMTAVLVQRMVPQGVEMIVGAVQDPLFGPLIACGTGGVLVDVLADTAFRLHPLSRLGCPRHDRRAEGLAAAARLPRRAAGG